MIIACPYCGKYIPQILKDGLASCTHCNQIFDSSLKNRLLSASWLVRKNNYSIDQLISDTRLPEHEAILVHSFIGENCYSIEDFSRVLNRLGIDNKAVDLAG